MDLFRINRNQNKIEQILKIIDLMKLLKTHINLLGIHIVIGISSFRKISIFDDKKAQKEVKEVSAYIFKQTIIMLHPLFHL